MANRIDVNWFNTDIGVQILNSIKQNGKLKNFGMHINFLPILINF